MEDRILAEGETTEEAINSALEQLGVGIDQVDVQVLEEPNKGLLGLRRAKAKVQVTVVNKGDLAKTIIEELLEKIGARVTVSIAQEDDATWVNINGESVAWLIGHHGRTLDALQV